MDLKSLLRPTWVEVNLDHVAYNMQAIRRLIKPGTEVMAVVKGDDCGHGAVEIAQTVLQNGASCLAVAIPDEGIELRRAGIVAPILVLGNIFPEHAKLVVVHDLIPTVYSRPLAEALSREAVSTGKTIKIHIKIDTGMGRIGVPAGEEAVSFVKEVVKLPGLQVEGVFTHFAKADYRDKSYTYQQFAKYMTVIEALKKQGIEVPKKHVANSATIIDLPEMHLDMVRTGILVYGLYPSDEVHKERVHLRPALEWKTRLSEIKKVPPGTAISYGCIYITKGEEVIGTLPVGYADGFTRMLTGKAEVLIRGRRVPVVGRICMDQCMIRVDDFKPEIGEEVVLIGRQGDEYISVEELAEKIGTFKSEILCSISRRVPRVYYSGGKVVKMRNLIGEWEFQV